MSLDKLSQLEHWVHGDLQPDLTLLFDVPLEVARERLQKTRDLDKFEQEHDDFFIRVRQVYLQRTSQFPQRIRVIDSTRPIDAIAHELQQVAASLCSK
jgi:dTMP kinase